MAGVCVFVASVCVCVCVKVVRHLLRSDEGIFERGEKALSQLAGHEDKSIVISKVCETI